MWILLLLILAVPLLLILHHREEAKEAAATKHVTPGTAITAATATQGNIGVYLNAIGTVTPVYTDSITSQVNGVIVAVHYTEGQRVRKGDPLVDIDSRPYLAMLLQAQGALERDQNSLPRRKWTWNVTARRGHATPSPSKPWTIRKSSSSRMRARENRPGDGPV